MKDALYRKGKKTRREILGEGREQAQEVFAEERKRGK